MTLSFFFFFFFNDTATTEIYTLSLHDALPISVSATAHATTPAYRTYVHATILPSRSAAYPVKSPSASRGSTRRLHPRSEEHTSELQSQSNLVCRLLLEKKKKKKKTRVRIDDDS